MDEKPLQDIFKNNTYNSRQNLLNVLGITDSSVNFIFEDSFPNGLFIDITIEKNNKVYCLAELKGTVGVNDYVRGTGQVVQYDYFIKNNITKKNYDLSTAYTVFLFPDTLIANNMYNIGLFHYPDTCRIIEYNETNHSLREITKKQLAIFAGQRGQTLVTVSSYYLRDIRVFEMYLYLMYCHIKKLLGYTSVDRQVAETFLKQLNVPDNNNWRNACIGISSLGLTDNKNLPNTIGTQYATMSYEEFAYEIYSSYIKTYIDILMDIFLKYQPGNCNMSLDDIAAAVNAKYNNRSVLIMTDSGNRYITSWMYIMQDDYGCISFPPRVKGKKNIIVNYDITKLNKEALISEIKNRTKATPYISLLKTLINI